MGNWVFLENGVLRDFSEMDIFVEMIGYYTGLLGKVDIEFGPV